MKLLLSIDQRAAIAAGIEAPASTMVIEMPLEKLTEQGRAYVARHIDLKTATIQAPRLDWNLPSVLPNATLDEVADLVNTKAAVVIAEVARQDAATAGKRVLAEAEKKSALDAYFAAPSFEFRHAYHGREVSASPTIAFAVTSDPRWDAPEFVSIRRAAEAAELERRNAEAAAKEAGKAREEAEAAAKTQAEANHLAGIIAAHGSTDQRERWEAGLLPNEEAMDLLRDVTFAPLAGFERYTKLTLADVERALTDEEEQAVDVGRIGAKYHAENCADATAEEWARLKEIRAAMPDAKVALRQHSGTLDSADVAWHNIRKGVLVTVYSGPFELTREYAA